MITRVSLKNWKSHLDSEFKFSRGVNALIGIMGSGKSLPYQEPVLIKEISWNKKSIGDVVENSLARVKRVHKEGDSIFTFENPENLSVQSLNTKTLKMETRVITSFIKHKAPAKLLRIITRTGKTITITKDHSVLVFKDGEILSQMGSEIKEGCYIPCPKKMDLRGDIDRLNASEILSDFRNTSNILDGLKLVSEGFSIPKAAKMANTTKKTLANWKLRGNIQKPDMIIGKHISIGISKEIPTSSEFAKISGAFISEGCVDYSEKKQRYKLCITNDNPDFLNVVKESWDKVFSSVPYNQIYNDFQANSKVTAALFERLYGSNSGNKCLHDIIYSFDDERLGEFLMMYFEGDGWVVPESNELACSSKSLNLIDGLSTILSRWGIITTIRKRKIAGGIYYDMKILPKHVPIFAKNVKFLSNNKQSKLNQLANNIERRGRWDGVDIIPDIKNLLHSLILEYHLSSRKTPKMRDLAKNFRIYMNYENIGREKLRKSLNMIFANFKHKTESFKKLEKLVNSDIFFDKVVKVEETKPQSEYVYDISVKGTENFVAGTGNMIAHNSAVMEAISFALYGTFPALKSRRIGLKDLIMKKPQKKSRAEVELDFEVNGIDYSIKRVVESGKGTTQAEIREKGELLDASAQGVTRIVERVLQMDYDLFSKAVYSEQDGLDYFLRIPKGQRMQHIDRMLKVDRFEKARGEAVSLGNRVRQAREEKLKMVSDLEKEGIGEKLRDAKKELDLLEKSRAELEAKIGVVRKRRGMVSERVSHAEKIEGKLNQTRTLLEGASYGLQETTETLKKRREKLRGRDLRKLSEDMERLGRESERLGAELREKSELLEKERSELASVNNMIKINQENIEGLEKAGARCPVCESEITREKRENLLRKRRGEQEGLRKQVGKIAGNMETLSKEKGDMERKLRDMDLETEKLKNLKDEAKDIEDLENKKKEYAERKAGLEKGIRDLEKEFKEAGLENLRKELQEIAAEESGIAERISGIEERVEDKRKILKDMRERADMLERYKEEARRNEEIAGQLGDFVKVLKITQDQLREEFLKTVNSIMDSIWGELYPYGDFERVRLAVDGDYVLQLKELGGWVSAEGGVSGGERSMACLALRIAFSLAFIPNLKWLILDEPTHNLDTNAIEQFADVLRERMGQFAEQVFLITHEERISEGVTGALYRLERNKEVNEPTRVVGE